MLVSLKDMQPLRREYAKQRIGYVIGTFDLFHVGHLDYLEWAWDNCDLLFVCVRSDAKVKQAKGSDRPIFPEIERARIVNSLKGTSFTHIASDFGTVPKPSIKVAKLLQPDLIILGTDWGNEAPLWRKELPGSQTVVCPMPYIKSTSRVINQIRFGR